LQLGGEKKNKKKYKNEQRKKHTVFSSTGLAANVSIVGTATSVFSLTSFNDLSIVAAYVLILYWRKHELNCLYHHWSSLNKNQIKKIEKNEH